LGTTITLDGQTLTNWTMCISGSLFDQAPANFTTNELDEYAEYCLCFFFFLCFLFEIVLIQMHQIFIVELFQ